MTAGDGGQQMSSPETTLATPPAPSPRPVGAPTVDGSAWRRFLVGLTLGYVFCLVAVLVALEWFGDRYWFLSFLLYLPPQGWLLPLFVLTPLAVIVRSRLVWVQLLCVVLVLFVYMDFHWSFWRAPGKRETVTLVTNNIGQNYGQSLLPFIEEERPDVVALQDSRHDMPDRGARKEWHVVVKDEFTLMSRFPIRDSGLVESVSWEGQPVAAWFELDCRGRTLVVYSVHMPTPRSDLLEARDLVAAVLRRDWPRFRRIQRSIQGSWENRLGMTEALARVLEKEKRPFLLAGDFNMPTHGFRYHFLASRLTDAFAAKGRGYGFTFPGVLHSPLVVLGPWLRLDYIFASPQLEPAYARAERHRPSQHRAVVARFEWNDEPEDK